MRRRWWIGGIVVAIGGVLIGWEIPMGEVPVYDLHPRLWQVWLWGIGQMVVEGAFVSVVLWGGWRLYRIWRGLVKECGEREKTVLIVLSVMAVGISIVLPMPFYPLDGNFALFSGIEPVATVIRDGETVQLFRTNGAMLVRWTRGEEGRIQLIECEITLSGVYWDGQQCVIVDKGGLKEYRFTFDTMGPEYELSVFEWLHGYIWERVETE